MFRPRQHFAIALLWWLLPVQGAQDGQNSTPTVVFRTNVVARSTKAVNYRHRSGSTEIDFRGTAILPKGEGKARIESKQGRIAISASFQKINPAYSIGPEYLTYVLWAITPEGRARNLGELLLNGNKSRIDVTTELQVFGLIVTAEPYFAVTQPSDVIVMENEIRPETKGQWDVIDAKYELLQRGQYAGTGSAQPPVWSAKIPIELIEARNAVRIAKLAGAGNYAKDVFEKSEKALASAEDYHDRQVGWKSVSMMARESVQRAEDARVIAQTRQQEERLALERKQAAEREAKAKLAAETELARRQQAEAERAAMEKAKLQAEQEKRDAEARALLARQQQAASEERQKRLAAEAEQTRLAAASQKRQARQRLLMQLSAASESRDTAQGIVVAMPEEFFEESAISAKPEVRERLARIAGLLSAYPGLRISIEYPPSAQGDATGEPRAGTLRDYLRAQGIDPVSVSPNTGERLALHITGEAIEPPADPAVGDVKIP